MLDSYCQECVHYRIESCDKRQNLSRYKSGRAKCPVYQQVEQDFFDEPSQLSILDWTPTHLEEVKKKMKGGD